MPRAIVLLILSVHACWAAADTAQRPLSDLVGARAAAVGDAYVAAPMGGPGHFHNPAGLGLARGVRLFAQTNVTGRGTVEMDPKGIAYGWRRWGAAWGNRIAEDEDGVADYTYLSAGASLSSHVAVGIAAKLWRSHPWPRFQALGGSATYDVGALVAGPAGWTFGARAGQLVRGGAPRAGAAGVWREGSRYSAGVEVEVSEGEGSRLSLGAEWRPTPPVAFRAGMRGSAPTAGVGLSVAGSAVDVAFTRYRGEAVLIVGVVASLAR